MSHSTCYFVAFLKNEKKKKVLVFSQPAYEVGSVNLTFLNLQTLKFTKIKDDTQTE